MKRKRQTSDDTFSTPPSKKIRWEKNISPTIDSTGLEYRWNIIESPKYPNDKKKAFREEIYKGRWDHVPPSLLDQYMGSIQSKFYGKKDKYGLLEIMDNNNWKLFKEKAHTFSSKIYKDVLENHQYTVKEFSKILHEKKLDAWLKLFYNKQFNQPLGLAVRNEYEKLNKILSDESFDLLKKFFIKIKPLPEYLAGSFLDSPKDGENFLSIIKKSGKNNLYDQVKQIIFNLALLHKKDISFNLWKNILCRFPEIQVLENGHSKQHPLFVAASKNWPAFKKAVNYDNPLFEPGQFANIIKPMDGIEEKCKKITKDIKYQRTVKTGDYFSVFAILYYSSQDDLLKKSIALALKDYINIIRYISGASANTNDLSSILYPNQYCVVLDLRSFNYNNERFDALYYKPGTEDYPGSVFDEKLRKYINAFIKKPGFYEGELPDDDITLDESITTNRIISYEDSQFEITIYKGSKEKCEKIQQRVDHHIQLQKKWLAFGYDNVANMIARVSIWDNEELNKANYGASSVQDRNGVKVKLSETRLPENISKIITSYCLPTP